jgi:hypothetical protein
VPHLSSFTSALLPQDGERAHTELRERAHTELRAGAGEGEVRLHYTRVSRPATWANIVAHGEPMRTDRSTLAIVYDENSTGLPVRIPHVMRDLLHRLVK